MDELFDLTQHQLASFPVAVYLYWLQSLLQPEMFLSIGAEGSKILLCMAEPLQEGGRRRSCSVFTEMYEVVNVLLFIKKFLFKSKTTIKFGTLSESDFMMAIL